MEYFQPPDPNSVFFREGMMYHFPPNQQQNQFIPPPPVNPYRQPQPELEMTDSSVAKIPHGKTFVLDPTPNAVSSLVTAIISLLLSILWLKWFGSIAGILSGCISLYLANSGMQMVETSPHVFSSSGLGNLRSAKLLSIISLSISGLWFIGLVVYFLVLSNEPSY